MSVRFGELERLCHSFDTPNSTLLLFDYAFFVCVV